MRKHLCNRVCFPSYISRPDIKARAPLQTSSLLSKDDKGLVQLKSIFMSWVFKHFSQGMLLSFRKQNKEVKSTDKWDYGACLFWFIPWPKGSQASSFAAAAPWLWRLMSKSSPAMRADREDLAASSRKRHFGCFVKSPQTSSCCCYGAFGSSVWRSHSEGSPRPSVANRVMEQEQLEPCAEEGASCRFIIYFSHVGWER